MKAVKGNKEYIIDETQKKSYQDMGYDIIGETGAVVAYGRGKTVPYGDYMTLKAENEELKGQVEKLETEIAELTAAAETKKAGE